MSHEITRLLIDWSGGDQEALARLMPLVEVQLHDLAQKMMRRERGDHTLQPTALVNEAYLVMVDQKRADIRSRRQFFLLASRMMNRVLLQHARRRRTAKRGGGAPHLPLEEELLPGSAGGQSTDRLMVFEALERLGELDRTQADIVLQRYYGQLRWEEIARAVGVSLSTVHREWRAARAWLQSELAEKTA